MMAMKMRKKRNRATIRHISVALSLATLVGCAVSWAKPAPVKPRSATGPMLRLRVTTLHASAVASATVVARRLVVDMLAEATARNAVTAQHQVAREVTAALKLRRKGVRIRSASYNARPVWSAHHRRIAHWQVEQVLMLSGANRQQVLDQAGIITKASGMIVRDMRFEVSAGRLRRTRNRLLRAAERRWRAKIAAMANGLGECVTGYATLQVGSGATPPRPRRMVLAASMRATPPAPVAQQSVTVSVHGKATAAAVCGWFQPTDKHAPHRN